LVELSNAIDQIFENKNQYIARNPGLVYLTENDYKPYVYKPTGESEFMFFGRNIDLDILRAYFSYATQEYIPTSNLNEDALTRDFTINSLYYNYKNKTLIDPANGLNDLKNNTLKFVFHANSILGNPFTVYRMIKFITRYRMKLDKNLEAVVTDTNFMNMFVRIL
jgi:tRNA nucleotidyltransferase/poly(A) polymerase